MNRQQLSAKWLLPLLFVLAVAAVATLNPWGARAAETATPSAVMKENWRLGMTTEGDSSAAATIGRTVGPIASFRSNRGVSDLYFHFPAPAAAKTVRAASFNIVSRDGTYSGNATMTLDVVNSAGTMVRRASASSVNIGTAPVGSWRTINLSGNAANLVVNPGESLVAHVTLSAGPADNLDVKVAFDIVVE